MTRHEDRGQQPRTHTMPPPRFGTGVIAVAMALAIMVMGGDRAFGQANAPMQVDEQTVDQFAQAIIAIREMESGFTQSLNEAQTATEEQRVRQEWNAAARDELATHGLSIDEYNQLIAMAQADPDFAAEVQERINSLQ